ncbi:MAG: N-acetylmuramoyl-L-alanine amidase family protein [Candidatus Aminicenantales bacterium]
MAIFSDDPRGASGLFRPALFLLLAVLAAIAVSPFPARAAALRNIVIDPGHGGLDAGAKGKFGSREKDVTLSIGLKLKNLIEKTMSYRVIMTREKDLDISLENRAAVANNNDAQLFISIHANGSIRKKAHGAETFFMNVNASDEETRKLAYYENTSGELDKQIAAGEQDEVKMILWDMAQSAYVRQSSRLAEMIQEEINQALRLENRGIKQAGFKVLQGVACPAVLVEVAFISNADEERKLNDEAFQNQVAETIYRGLSRYLKLFPQK